MTRHHADPFVARQRRQIPAAGASQIPLFDQEKHNIWLALLEKWYQSSADQRLKFARLGGNHLSVEEQLELMGLIHHRSGTC